MCLQYISDDANIEEIKNDLFEAVMAQRRMEMREENQRKSKIMYEDSGAGKKSVSVDATLIKLRPELSSEDKPLGCIK